MKLWRQAAVLTLALTSATAAWSAGAEPEVGVIRWQVLDMPPAFSFANGRAPRKVSELGHGEIDGFMRLLIEQMPQYRHEFVEAGIARFEAMARQEQAVCSLALVRTRPRMEWLFFTPIFPPLESRQIQVIVRRDRLSKFVQTPGQVLQLSELLKRRDVTGLLTKDRSFGPQIDALLSAQGADGPQAIAPGHAQLMSMLRAGRMDYVLEYPVLVKEFLRRDGPGPELVMIPISEGLSSSMVYAACGRNPEGRRAIEAVDRAERQLAQDPRREALLRSWRGDALEESDRVRLKRFMDERARAGARIE